MAIDREKIIGFLEHLNELALTIRNAALVLLVGCLIGLYFSRDILQTLIAPYGGKLQVLGPTEGISILIRVGLAIGAALSSPIVIYVLLGFITPGLQAHEKRPLLLVVPGAFILFLIGATFAWFIMIPSAIEFLATFQVDIFNIEWTAERYVPFVLSLTLWVGISFEMPLVFMFLGWVGIVRPGQLVKAWRIAVVIIAIIAAAITPTVDPFNMMLVMAPLLALYVLSIFLTAITYAAYKRRAAPA